MPIARTTIAQALTEGAARLQVIADNPRREARLLLAHALRLTQNDLIRDPGRTIDPTGYRALLVRREAHEPIAHLTGQREFWSLTFQVSPATLIPRPDSETLIEAALDAFTGHKPPERILDLGTGTGCLLLALLGEFPQAFGIGIDINPAAAALAQTNARALGLRHRAAFLAGNWIDPLSGGYDLIVSNPPYIAAGDIPELMPEVAAHEPWAALDGGTDGFDAYRTIIPALERHLSPGGVAVLELGIHQSDMLLSMAAEAGLTASLRLDLGQIPRAIVLSWPNR